MNRTDYTAFLKESYSEKSFDDVEDEKDKYDNTFSLYFEKKCCLFALPNVEGFKYLVD